MTTYRWADGEDVILGSLTVLNPQPSADFVQTTERNFAADGTVSDQGKFVVWRWTVIQNVTELQAILTVLGIQSATSNRGTLYTRAESGSFVRYNGTAIRPEPGRDIQQRDYFLRDLRVLIRDLEVAA